MLSRTLRRLFGFETNLNKRDRLRPPFIPRLEPLEERTLLTSNLQVSLSAPSTVAAGAGLIYTITVRNSGTTAASGVSLYDALPSGETYRSQSQTSGPGFSLGVSGNTIGDSISSLAAGASATFSVTGLVSGGDANGTVLTDSATVGGSGSSSSSAPPSPPRCSNRKRPGRP